MKEKDIFDQLWEGKELPEEAKDAFFKKVEALKFIANIADIVTIKQMMAGGAVLKAIAEKNNEE